MSNNKSKIAIEFLTYCTGRFFQGTFANKGAGFQQYTIATAVLAAKVCPLPCQGFTATDFDGFQIPNGISYDEASTIPVALATAYFGLYNSLPYGAGLPDVLDGSDGGEQGGKPLVVLGGSSSVGQLGNGFHKLNRFPPLTNLPS